MWVPLVVTPGFDRGTASPPAIVVFLRGLYERARLVPIFQGFKQTSPLFFWRGGLHTLGIQSYSQMTIELLGPITSQAHSNLGSKFPFSVSVMGYLGRMHIFVPPFEVWCLLSKPIGPSAGFPDHLWGPSLSVSTEVTKQHEFYMVWDNSVTRIRPRSPPNHPQENTKVWSWGLFKTC